MNVVEDFISYFFRQLKFAISVFYQVILSH